MKRLWLIPISALILIVGAGATAGLIAAGQERPSPAEQVQTVDKVAPGYSHPPGPCVQRLFRRWKPLTSRGTAGISSTPTSGPR